MRWHAEWGAGVWKAGIVGGGIAGLAAMHVGGGRRFWRFVSNERHPTCTLSVGRGVLNVIAIALREGRNLCRSADAAREHARS